MRVPRIPRLGITFSQIIGLKHTLVQPLLFAKQSNRMYQNLNKVLDLKWNSEQWQDTRREICRCQFIEWFESSTNPKMTKFIEIILFDTSLSEFGSL